jgi:hypothetical protein
MDFDEACDEIDEIVETFEFPERITMFRNRSDELAPGEDGRAEFLTSLAGELELAEDVDGARATYLAAMADGGPTQLEPRCGLLSIELTAGDDNRVKELLQDLLSMARADTLTSLEYEWIGESLEEAGRFRDAMRWFTIPLRDFDPDDVESLPPALLHGRWRVRRALEMPHDAYDDAREVWRQVQPHLD